MLFFIYCKIPVISSGLIQLRKGFMAGEQKILCRISVVFSKFGANFCKESPLRNCGVLGEGTIGICFITKLIGQKPR